MRIDPTTLQKQQFRAQHGDLDKVCRSVDKRHRAFPLDQDGTSILGPDLMFASFRVQHDIPGAIPPMVITLAAGQDDDHLQPLMAMTGNRGTGGVAQQGDVRTTAAKVANLDPVAEGLERHVLPTVGHEPPKHVW